MSTAGKGEGNSSAPTLPPEWSKTESSINAVKEYLRCGNTIDFFERITRCILAEQPRHLASFVLNLLTEFSTGQDIPYNVSVHAEEPQVQAYLHERQVSEFIDRWVLALLAEEPRPASDKERMKFHLKFITQCAQESASEMSD